MTEVIKGADTARHHPPTASDGIQECPKCMYTMEYLRDSAFLNRDYGVSLDTGSVFRWYEPDDNVVTSFLFGNLYRFLYRSSLEPFFSRFVGNRHNRRFQKILKEYPNSLICPHCEYVIKRK